MAMAAVWTRAGYFQSECPNGGGIHLSPVSFQVSGELRDFKMTCGWPADTPTEPCAACAGGAK